MRDEHTPRNADAFKRPRDKSRTGYYDMPDNRYKYGNSTSSSSGPDKNAGGRFYIDIDTSNEEMKDETMAASVNRKRR